DAVGRARDLRAGGDDDARTASCQREDDAQRELVERRGGRDRHDAALRRDRQQREATAVLLREELRDYGVDRIGTVLLVERHEVEAGVLRELAQAALLGHLGLGW